MAERLRTVLPVLIGIASVLVLWAIVIPGVQSANRASRERMAATAMKTLTAAEADFRANDRDRNHVNDFWTGDVSGLYYVKSADGGAEVRLIDVDVANADSKPIHPLPSGSGPRKGYCYQALDRDNSVEGEHGIYRVDTDRSGRKVHNLALFGFLTFPVNGDEGNFSFAVNERNTVFTWRPTPLRTTWPSGDEFKKMGCPLCDP